MRKRGKALFQILVMLGITAFVGGSGYGNVGSMNEVMATEVSVEKTSETTNLPDANPEDKVIFNTDVGAIILNGNSVIIQASDTEGNEEDYCNIILDKDQDGIVDDGEEKVSVVIGGGDATTEIRNSYPIYGVYQANLAEPMTVYYDCYGTAFYGIYQGGNTAELSVYIRDGEHSVVMGAMQSTALKAPVYVEMSGGSVPYLFGLNNATTISSTEVVLSGGKVTTQIRGVLGSEVNTSASPAVALTVSGGSSVETQATVGSTISTSGDVAVKFEVTGGSIGGSTQQSPQAIMASYQSIVKAGSNEKTAIDFDITGSPTVVSNVYVAYGYYSTDGTNTNSNIIGNVDINVDFDNTPESTNIYSIYGIVKSCKVDGSVTTNVNNVYTSTIYNAYTDYSDTMPITISGDSIINCTNTYVSGCMYNIYGGVAVGGDVQLTNDDKTYFSTLYCVSSNCSVAGNVILDVYGNTATTNFGSYNNWYILSGKMSDKDYTVGGNVDLNIRGGELGTLYVIGDSAAIVNGKVDVNITDANVYSMYGIYVSTTVIKGDVTYTVDSSHFKNVTYLNSAKIMGDLKVNMTEDCSWQSSFYGMNGGSVEGDCTLDLYNTSTVGNGTSFYGVSGANVGGNVKISLDGGTYSSYMYGIYNTSTSYTIGGDVDIDITNIKTTSAVYGMNGAYNGTQQFGGEIDVNISDIEMSYSDCYGLYCVDCLNPINVTINRVTTTGDVYGITSGTSINNNIKIDLTNNTADYLYGVNNYSGLKYPTVTLTGNTISSKMYGLYNVSAVAEDVVITSSGNTFKDCNMIYAYGNYQGNVTITSTNDKTSDSATEDNVVYMVYNNPTILGNLDVTISENTLASFEGVQATVNGTVTMNVKSTSIGGSQVTFFYGYNTDDLRSQINVNVEGSTFTTDGVKITNGFDAQHMDMKISDDCTMPNTYTIEPISSTFQGSPASAIVYCKGNIYFSGINNITADMLTDADNIYFINAIEEIPVSLTATNLYFDNSEIGIAKGVTVEATDKLSMTGGLFALEGTIKGTPVQTMDTLTSKFFINGGQTDGFTPSETVYYPITCSYLSEGGLISVTGVSSTRLRIGVSYAQSNAEVIYKVTPNKGYSVNGGTVTMEGDSAPRDMSVTDSTTYKTYSFTMEDKLAEVDITIEGTQIKLGKTVADPIAKVNVATTKDAPIYDLSSVAISNDATKGEVTYTVDEIYGLPTGLVLKNGKIYGTPTVVNESGTKTVIHITGRNGTEADLTLNIVVTAGEGQQTSQDGRIMMDSEKQTIHLFGNSVVIEADGDNTALYLDDNQDGEKDSEKALVSDDLSLYTVYGFADTESDKNIKITMYGGTIRNIYGAYNSTLSFSESDKDAMDMKLLGGTVTYGYALYNSEATGSIAYKRTSGVSNGALTGGATNTYSSALYNNNGSVTIDGSYTLKEDLEATTLTQSVGTYSAHNSLVIPKNKKVKLSGKLTMVKYADIYCSGTLDIGGYSANTYAKIYMLEGSTFLPEGNTYGYVYYPVICSSSHTKLVTTGYVGTSEITVDGEKILVAKASDTVYLSSPAPAGYDRYHSVNGAEPTLSTSSIITFTMERKVTHVDITYLATQIEVDEQFAAPMGIKGTTYTTENPLYDYNKITINNDTIASYGGEIKYTLKSGTLPAGLYLEDGKVIGTPKTSNGDGVDVTVTVTGHNGTTADVTLKYQIADTKSDAGDINELLSFDGTTLDLKGNSVVIFAGDTSGTSNVYLDTNHDGVADYNQPFLYNGSKDINLANAVVCGYSDTSKAYDGDISIYLRGGTIGWLYGAKGTGASGYVTVNGSVSVYVKSGTVNKLATSGYYVSADTINLSMTGGIVNNQVYAAYYPKDVTTVNFEMTKQGTYYNTNSGNSYSSAVVYGGNISGNVNVRLGVSSSSYGFTTVYSRFFGIYASNVAGDVNYVINGLVRPYADACFAYKSTVAGDLNVDWQSGSILGSSTTLYMVNKSTVRDINVKMKENMTISSYSSEWYPIVNGATVRNIVIEAPSYTGRSFTTAMFDSSNNTTSTITGTAYINNMSSIEVYGDYTLNENTDAVKLTVYENSTLTIPEGTILNTTDAVIVDGILVNNGTWNQKSYAYVCFDVAGGSVVNDGIWNQSSTIFVGYDYDNGTVTNNGTWNQKSNVYAGHSTNYSGSKITNNGQWTSDGKLYVYNTIENTATGVWTTNRGIETKAKSVISNIGVWNSNYGGSTVDTYGILSYGTIQNAGTWTNENYLRVYSGSKIVNEGTFVVNPLNNSSSDTSSVLYLYDTDTSFVNKADATLEFVGRMSNNGIVYNYGTFKQTYKDGTYHKRLGKIYFASEPELSGAYSDYTSSTYNTFYFPIEVEYPTYMITSASHTGTQSGYEGDENYYVAAGTEFTVTIDSFEAGYTASNIKDVTYGNPEETATANSDTSFVGTMPYGATTATVNMNALAEAPIVLSPTSTTVDALTVGEYAASVYNMSNVVIDGDTAVENGYVTYTVSKDAPLPDGLILENGIISGTPTTASAEPQVSEIIVTGQNQTRATFTITFTKIEKGTPKLYVPSFSAKTGDTLADVIPPKTSLGTYSWPDTSVEVTDKALAGETFTLNFDPNDEENYDWSKLDSTIGTWNAEEGVVKLQVKISLNKIAPDYTKPTGLTAQYGQTLEDVVLPSDENGTFTWYNPTTTSVGAVGTKYFYVTYTPKDTDRYSTVNYIQVTLTVEKADKEAPTINKPLKAYEGDAIASVILPDVEGGTYQWVTTSDTIVESGKTYKVVFKPDDTENYNWSSSQDGAYYSSLYGGVILSVTIDTSLRPISVYDVPIEINGVYGNALSSIVLPSVVNGTWYLGNTVIASPSFSAEDLPNGKYMWVNPAEVIDSLEEHGAELRFVPDSDDYGVSEVISVDVKVSHTCVWIWQKDENTHWQECICGESTEDAVHTYGEGVVIKAATTTEDGVMQYSCTACGHAILEDIPMLDPEDSGEMDIPPAGTVLENKLGKFVVADASTIDYEDDEEETDDATPIVVYNGPADTSSKSVVIPDTITVDDITYKVTAIADGAFKKNKKLTNVTIGNNIKKIGNSAFESCTKLKKVTFKKTSKVVTIGNKAFYKSTALTSISIPASVKNINDSALDGCKNLKTVSFAQGSKLKKIGKKAFNNCTVLKKITIPDKTTTIGSKAFYNCKKLTNITIKTEKLTAKSVGKQVFTKAGSSNYKKLVVKVPKKSLTSYKKILVQKGLSKKAKIKK